MEFLTSPFNSTTASAGVGFIVRVYLFATRVTSTTVSSFTV